MCDFMDWNNPIDDPVRRRENPTPALNIFYFILCGVDNSKWRLGGGCIGTMAILEQKGK